MFQKSCKVYITNKPETFCNGKIYETSLSDFHKLVLSIVGLSYKKISLLMIKYRNCKKFSNEHFENSLNENLANNTKCDYNTFYMNSPETITFSSTIL